MACGNRISRHLLSCREAGFTKAIGAGLKANTQVPTTRPLEAQTCRTRLTLLLPQAQDLPAEVLQRILDRIESGDLDLLPVHSYPLADIAQAHEDMALGRHVGKLVGLPWS